MVRTLIATMAFAASMAVACPTCGCQDSKTTEVSSKTAECATECASSCESTCDKTAAATMAVADTKSGSCCSENAAATMAVADTKSGESCSTTCSGDAATMTVAGENKACSSECAPECVTACKGGKALVSFASYMPAMTYKVGDESMACSKMAGAMAKEHNTHMHYVVKGVEYDDKAKAMTAHAKQLEGMMMDLVRVQYAVNGECVACPDSAKEMAASCETKKLQYRVGPATFDNAEDAIKASIMAYNAAMSTKMEYAVNGMTTTCSVTASDMAKSNNCSVEYVVNGQRTNCKTSAGYMKTLASVRNALKALETATSASSDA
jgi:hypothetical protein